MGVKQRIFTHQTDFALISTVFFRWCCNFTCSSTVHTPKILYLIKAKFFSYFSLIYISFNPGFNGFRLKCVVVVWLVRLLTHEAISPAKAKICTNFGF